MTNKVHPLKKVRGPDPNYKDICFAGAGRYYHNSYLFSLSILLMFSATFIRSCNMHHITSRNVSQLSEVFPKVDMVFGNGQKLSLSPENYLFRVIHEVITF